MKVVLQDGSLFLVCGIVIMWWKRSISVYLLKGYTADLYCLWDTFLWFWSQKQMVTVCIASSKTISKLQTDRRMDSSCKWRACCLPRSLVIVHTRVVMQRQASFTWDELVCLLEVSVIEQILWNKFPGNWASMHKQYVSGFFFFAHAQEPENEADYKQCGVVVCELTYLASLPLLTHCTQK